MRRNHIRFEWVSASEFRFEWAYQRYMSKTKLKKMIANWDPDVVGVIIASERDGLWTIDGQHRVSAALEIDPDIELPTLIYSNLTKTEEAYRFAMLNGERATVGQFDLFKARLSAGDAEALEVEKVLTNLGLKFATSAGHGRIESVKKCLAINRRGGPVLLDAVLRAGLDAWGDESSSFPGYVLGALATVIHKNPHYDHGRLVRTLQKFGTANILTAKATAIGRNVESGAARVTREIIEAYNLGLRNGNKRLSS